ncbi:hypothetical protein SSX86_014411 [Deinandra increscens subsp. villosa]|uniref:Uncharacterized protein n=1 Tax=Deinandra increscens subsp. villosa TaxID=3103831 RepID=A0AAP0D6C7_9ASTR
MSISTMSSLIRSGSSTHPCLDFSSFSYNRPTSQLSLASIFISKNDKDLLASYGHINLNSSRSLLHYDHPMMIKTTIQARPRRFVIRNNLSTPPPPEVPLPPAKSPLKSWRNWIVGIVLTFVLPFFTHKWGPLLVLKNKVDKVVNTTESMMETLETVSEQVDKVIDSITYDLPQTSELRKILEALDAIVERVAKSARIANYVIDQLKEIKLMAPTELVENKLQAVLLDAKEDKLESLLLATKNNKLESLLLDVKGEVAETDTKGALAEVRLLYFCCVVIDMLGDDEQNSSSRGNSVLEKHVAFSVEASSVFISKNKDDLLASYNINRSRSLLQYDPMMKMTIQARPRRFVIRSNITPPPSGVPLPPAGSPSGSLRNWIVGIVLTFVLPFCTHKWGPLLVLKNKVDNVVNTAEYMVETLEAVAEKVDKVIDSITDDLPQTSELRKTLEAIDAVVEGVAKTAHIADNIIDQVEEVEDKLESLILKEAKDKAPKQVAEKDEIPTQEPTTTT